MLLDVLFSSYLYYALNQYEMNESSFLDYCFSNTDMIMHRVIFLLIVYCALVNGDCTFHTDDVKDKKLQENIKNWGIFGKIYDASTNASKYQIGICSSPISSLNDTAILQTETNTSYVLGELNPANLVGGDNWMLLTYENGSRYSNECDNKTRSASIMFVCGQTTGNITVVQEHTSKDKHCNYMFQFDVSQMCAVVPVEKKKLSGGAIFLIIILCLASAYLIIGFLFMRIKRGARGIDQIPNLEMWRKIGGLAADGCDFCCRCNTGAPRAGYFLDDSGPDMRGDDDILSP